MDPITAGALITGGAGMIGSFMNRGSQQATNAQNLEMHYNNQDFVRSMSNTAHQREVKDLMDAGLNPNLSAGGNGASTPNTSAPTLQAPMIDTTPIMQAVSLAQSQRKLDLDQQRVTNETAKTTAQLGKTEVDNAYTKAKTELSNKGMPRAILEGEISRILRSGIKEQRKYFDNMRKRGAEMEKYGNPLTMP